MRLIAAVRRRCHPLYGLMVARDYRRALTAPQIQAGDALMPSKPIRDPDNHGSLHSMRKIFQDEVCRFEAKTDAPRIVDAGVNIRLSACYFKRSYPGATIVVHHGPALGAM